MRCTLERQLVIDSTSFIAIQASPLCTCKNAVIEKFVVNSVLQL